MRGSVTAVVGLLSMLVVGNAQAAKLIAVLPLDVAHVEGKLSKAGQAALEEMLRDTATDVLTPKGWTVLTGETTIQVLRDNGVKPEECGDQECHLANARELKVEKFISGAVQFVDDQFTASIRLIDTSTGRIVASERVSGNTVSSLCEAFMGKSKGFFEKGMTFTETSQLPPTPKEQSVPETSKEQPVSSPLNAPVGALKVRFGGDKWSLLDATQNVLCRTPCTQWVGRNSGWKLQFDASRREDIVVVEVPKDFGYSSGSAVFATPHTERLGGWQGRVLGALLAVFGGAAGVAGTAVTLSGSDSGARHLMIPGITALAGGIVLAVFARDSGVDVSLTE